MSENIMTMRLTATVLLFVIIGTSVTVAADAIIVKKVDFFEMRGDKEKKLDARLELDPEAKILTLSDEKNGIEKATYAVSPYSQINRIVYERSSHRRYKSGLLVTPWLLFSKGKKHWLTIEFDDVADQQQNFVCTRLDKNNYRRIIASLEAGIGLEVEEIIKD